MLKSGGDEIDSADSTPSLVGLSRPPDRSDASVAGLRGQATAMARKLDSNVREATTKANSVVRTQAAF